MLTFLENAAISGAFHPPLPGPAAHGSVSLWDESYSTVEAYDDALDARLGTSRTATSKPRSGAGKAADKFRKSGKEDAVAAAIILQRVLDELRRAEEDDLQ